MGKFNPMNYKVQVSIVLCFVVFTLSAPPRSWQCNHNITKHNTCFMAQRPQLSPIHACVGVSLCNAYEKRKRRGVSYSSLEKFAEPLSSPLMIKFCIREGKNTLYVHIWFLLTNLSLRVMTRSAYMKLRLKNKYLKDMLNMLTHLKC